MKIKHTYKKYFYDCYWNGQIYINNEIYRFQIEYNSYFNYYMGYLWINHSQNEYITFGYSDYMGTVKYILKNIKQYLDGDYRYIGDFFGTLKPSDL